MFASFLMLFADLGVKGCQWLAKGVQKVKRGSFGGVVPQRWSKMRPKWVVNITES